MLFSVVMPAYNEEAVIAGTVGALAAALDAAGLRYEILVVDDASADGTAGVVERLAANHPALRLIRNPGPNGYGFAIRKGLEQYTGDAAVIVTSDGADAPKDVIAYFDAIAGGADCAFGARFGAGSTVTGYPPVKRVINRMANRILGWLVRSSYRDFTNGFKCYRRAVIDAMQPLVSGQFNITIEMSLKAVQGGWSFVVLPNDWTEREAGQSTFRILKLVMPYAATMIYCLTLRYLRSIRRN